MCVCVCLRWKKKKGIPPSPVFFSCYFAPRKKKETKKKTKKRKKEKRKERKKERKNEDRLATPSRRAGGFHCRRGDGGKRSLGDPTLPSFSTEFP